MFYYFLPPPFAQMPVTLKSCDSWWFAIYFYFEVNGDILSFSFIVKVLWFLYVATVVAIFSEFNAVLNQLPE